MTAADEVAMMLRRVAASLSAGLPVPRAWRLAAGEGAPAPIREACRRVAEMVELGRELPAALRLARVVPEECVQIVEAYSHSGTLDRAMASAAGYLSWRCRLANRVRAALAYPAAVIAVLLLVSAVVLAVAVPAFSGLYRAVGAQLPWPTRVLVAMSEAVTRWWPALVVAGVLAVFGVRAALGTPWGRGAALSFLARAPVLGRLVVLEELARSSRLFAELHAAGVVALRSLEACAAVCAVPFLRQAWLECRQSVLGGVRLSESMRRTGAFPAIFLEMVATGEESGRLSECLEAASTHFQEELDYRSSVLMALMEPAASLLVGGLALGVALALYLPVFDIPSLVFRR